MSGVKVAWLPSKLAKADSHFALLRKIFEGVGELLNELKKFDPQIAPFHDTENCGVSVISAGAAKVGFSPLCEYWLKKRTVIDRRRWHYGRADLWILAGKDTASFEFKRADNFPSVKNLAYMKQEASKDIGRIPRSECSKAFSCLIAPVFDLRSVGILKEFSKQNDLTCQIGSGVDSAFLFFNVYR